MLFGKEEKRSAFSLITQRETVNSFHKTLVCICIAMTPFSRMKSVLKKYVPAWIMFLIPFLCS